MHGPAESELSGGGTRGEGKGELKSLTQKSQVPSGKRVALSLLSRRQDVLEVAGRTDQSRGRQGKEQGVQRVTWKEG